MNAEETFYQRHFLLVVSLYRMPIEVELMRDVRVAIHEKSETLFECSAP